jgi:hypothetical protein
MKTQFAKQEIAYDSESYFMSLQHNMHRKPPIK